MIPMDRSGHNFVDFYRMNVEMKQNDSLIWPNLWLIVGEILSKLIIASFNDIV